MSPSQRSFHPEMLQWLIIPALLIWFSASYLLGIAAQPVWLEHESQKTAQVLAISKDQPPALPAKSDFIWNQTGLVTFWFDDGWLTQYTLAAPLLNKYGYTAAISIPTDLIGYEAYMSWGQVKRLFHVYNWEITAHSRTHNCDRDTFAPEILTPEIIGSQQDLMAQGIRPDIYVVPCGKTTPELIKLVKDNYISMRDATGGLNPIPINDPYTIHAFTLHDHVSLDQVQLWLDQAQTEKLWLILMFHQLDTTGGEYSLDPKKFEVVIQQVTQAGLPVVNPSQVINLLPR
ncbi:hypothetical protein A2W24_01525 [Microgenomates group bacterium RBG_16_45_19]|nr:MAG: hypothetical protein A2W24_01525 [Microgenomates group bacterium RBG_16_45_19]